MVVQIWYGEESTKFKLIFKTGYRIEIGKIIWMPSHIPNVPKCSCQELDPYYTMTPHFLPTKMADAHVLLERSCHNWSVVRNFRGY